MTHRFFIPSEWLTPPTVTLHEDTARQIKTVLRMQPGDEIVVLDNSGLAYRVRLTSVDKREVAGEIVDQGPAEGEPQLHLSLYQGTLKAQKFEWVLQKGTELGLSRFVPTICERSIANDSQALQKKHPRWQRIIQEAAEQSGRGQLPQLDAPLSYEQALSQIPAETLILLPWEAAKDTPSLKSILKQATPTQIALFIGPEGGFSAHEADAAHQNGAHLIKLGPRILRAETAGLAACAAILYELDEWV